MKYGFAVSLLLVFSSSACGARTGLELATHVDVDTGGGSAQPSSNQVVESGVSTSSVANDPSIGQVGQGAPSSGFVDDTTTDGAHTTDPTVGSVDVPTEPDIPPLPPAGPPDPTRSPVTLCNAEGWCGANADFTAIWGTSETDIWVVANHSLPKDGEPLENSAFGGRTVLVHWDGREWATTSLDGVIGSYAELHDVWGSAPNDYWATGSNLLHFDGSSWAMFTVDASGAAPMTVLGTSRDNVWGTGSNGAAFYFDGGSWLSIPSSTRVSAVWPMGDGAALTEQPPITDLWGQGSTPVVATNDDGTLMHWDGEAWVTSPGLVGGPIQWQDLWGRSASDVWAVGSRGAIAHWDGATWSYDASNGQVPNTANLNAVWGYGRYVYVVGDEGTFLRWDGSDWTRSAVGALDAKTMWGASDDDVWAAGADLAHFDGDAWALVEPPWTSRALGLWGFSVNDVWAVGEGGMLAHYDGAMWRTEQSPESDTLTAVWGAAPNDIWAVSELGHLVHYDGAAWTLVKAGDFGKLNGVWGTSASDILAVGDHRIHYDGSQWTALPEHPTEFPNYVVAFGDSEAIWIGGSVQWSAYKAGGANPELGRWKRRQLTDDLEPDLGIYNEITAGAAIDEDDIWIAGPELMHWDGATWSWSRVGGDEGVSELFATQARLWAVTSSGDILERRR